MEDRFPFRKPNLIKGHNFCGMKAFPAESGVLVSATTEQEVELKHSIQEGLRSWLWSPGIEAEATAM